jgi:conjugal transfer pilus assembly protein TraW
MRVACVGAALALSLSLPVAQARDLGAIGPVHAITEPDMLKEIEAKLRAKQASGELAGIEAEAQRRIQARIETPPPVSGLRRAQVPRSFRFDPSVRFDDPIVDTKGRVIVPAGTNANPLSVVTLRSTLLFFDGRDPAQVAMARAEIAATKTQVTPILVGGSPAALARQWQRPVYFDQNGQMVQRFQISAVPARVTQDGMYLLVQEFVAP